MAFKDFIDERDAAFEACLPREEVFVRDRVLSYRGEITLLGSKMMSSRQPPQIHAYLNIMEKYIFHSSKADIIFHSIIDSFSQFLDTVPEGRRQSIIDEFRAEFDRITESLKDKEGEK